MAHGRQHLPRTRTRTPKRPRIGGPRASAGGTRLSTSRRGVNRRRLSGRVIRLPRGGTSPASLRRAGRSRDGTRFRKTAPRSATRMFAARRNNQAGRGGQTRDAFGTGRGGRR